METGQIANLWLRETARGFESPRLRQREGLYIGRPLVYFPATAPYARQTEPIMFRFPGLRKRRESYTAIGFVFLSNTDPLRWALCSYEAKTRSGGKPG